MVFNAFTWSALWIGLSQHETEHSIEMYEGRKKTHCLDMNNEIGSILLPSIFFSASHTQFWLNGEKISRLDKRNKKKRAMHVNWDDWNGCRFYRKQTSWPTHWANFCWFLYFIQPYYLILFNQKILFYPLSINVVVFSINTVENEKKEEERQSSRSVQYIQYRLIKRFQLNWHFFFLLACHMQKNGESF